VKSVMNINYHTTSSVLLTEKLFVRRESWKFHHTILKGVAFCSGVTYLDKCVETGLRFGSLAWYDKACGKLCAEMIRKFRPNLSCMHTLAEYQTKVEK
jgi:hypothetical protein